MHDNVLVAPRCRTVQYTRSFVPACVTLWNNLDGSVFDGVDLNSLKSSVNRALLG